MLVALAAVLPALPRRSSPGCSDWCSLCSSILKVLDIGFFTAFERPFDPLGATPAMHRSASKRWLHRSARQQANLIAVRRVVLSRRAGARHTVAVLRLSEVAARNRRASLRVVARSASVWLALLGWPARSSSPTARRLDRDAPPASSSREVNTVKTEIHDRGVFAKEIKHDTVP